MGSTLEALALPNLGVITLVLVIGGIWIGLPYLVAAGRAIIAFAANLCFALFALGFIGFVAFGLIRTICHPWFSP